MPGGIRTPNPLVRSQVRYPISPQAHIPTKGGKDHRENPPTIKQISAAIEITQITRDNTGRNRFPELITNCLIPPIAAAVKTQNAPISPRAAARAEGEAGDKSPTNV